MKNDLFDDFTILKDLSIILLNLSIASLTIKILLVL